jgi:hypothetical protein
MGHRGLLVYQPNHGLGVELALVHHAARLGRLLDRTVVLPLVPILETLQYQGGLEEYFELPGDLDWISTAAFRQRHGGQIDQLYQLLPHWRPDYWSSVVRDLHPVWLQNIRRYTYFSLAGLGVRRVSRQVIARPLTAEAARERFATDATTIGFTYLHSVLTGDPAHQLQHNNHFYWLDDAPPHPRTDFLEAVELALGGRPNLALHIRRANLEMARIISGVELPPITAFQERIPADPGLVYVATDVDAVLEEICQKLPDARRIRTGHITRDAVLDLSACALAEHFIGTHFSTFSHYIVHARSRLGRDPSTTVLL